MEPHAEIVHWWFGMAVLVLGLIMVAEGIVGREVWQMRQWRVYLWPSIAFGLGILMWPVMALYTNSAIHMIAHGMWAQALMIMGAAELGLAKGKLTEPLVAARGAGRDRALGRRVPRPRAEPVVLRPGRVPAPPDRVDADRRGALPARARRSGRGRPGSKGAFGLFVIALAVMLFCDRDVAPVFGHLSPLAGAPHR